MADDLSSTCTNAAIRHAFAQAAPAPGERSANRRVQRGEQLVRPGDAFGILYLIRYGFFKTDMCDRDGHQQVTGFFMEGEVLGLEGMGDGLHAEGITALEDSEVLPIPSASMWKTGRTSSLPGQHISALLAGEIARSHATMLMLGSLSADERLAAFLLDLSGRFLARGYSGSCFRLRMSRDEIGSFIGVKLETVSRLLSDFQKRGLIRVHLKQVDILDRRGLERAQGRSRRADPPRRRKPLP